MAFPKGPTRNQTDVFLLWRDALNDLPGLSEKVDEENIMHSHSHFEQLVYSEHKSIAWGSAISAGYSWDRRATGVLGASLKFGESMVILGVFYARKDTSGSALGVRAIGGFTRQNEVIPLIPIDRLGYLFRPYYNPAAFNHQLNDTERFFRESKGIMTSFFNKAEEFNHHAESIRMNQEEITNFVRDSILKSVENLSGQIFDALDRIEQYSRMIVTATEHHQTLLNDYESSKRNFGGLIEG